MKMVPVVFLLLAWPAMAVGQVPAGQATPLTLDQALARARNRGPLILAARDRIDEARGRLKGASVLFRDNPAIEFTGGPRRSTSGDSTDTEFGISQAFELGGRRASRIAAAGADVERETAASQNASREVLRDVAAAFWRSVAAGQRVQVADAADEIARNLLRLVERRFELGDVPVLEVNVARNVAARARSELNSAAAQQIVALADLRILLGMAPSENFAVQGDLQERHQYQLEPLIAEAQDRPDLRAIAAELRQAEAEARLGRGFAWPDVRLGFSHGRDEGDTVTKAAFTFTIPVFSRGQELRAMGEARAVRLRRQLEAGKLAVEIDVRSALEVLQTQIQAADALATAARSLDENETLARRSYEEGEINLFELLQVRRELFETRLQYVNRLLDAALAEVELQARAGVLR